MSSQAAFAKEQELNFRLLSDPDGSAAAKFGAARPKRPFARRLTFVIDEKGVLRHIDDKVDVQQHGTDLAELIRKLRG